MANMSCVALMEVYYKVKKTYKSLALRRCARSLLVRRRRRHLPFHVLNSCRPHPLLLASVHPLAEFNSN